MSLVAYGDSDSEPEQAKPVPPSKPVVDPALQAKVEQFHQLKEQQGRTINNLLRGSKDFKNPTIYSKLVTFCDVDENASNYPPHIYNPKGFPASDFYDEIARDTQKYVDNKELNKKFRTSISFVQAAPVMDMSSVPDEFLDAAAAGDNGDVMEDGSRKRKSKWGDREEPAQIPRLTQESPHQQPVPPPDADAQIAELRRRALESLQASK